MKVFIQERKVWVKCCVFDFPAAAPPGDAADGSVVVYGLNNTVQDVLTVSVCVCVKLHTAYIFSL